MTIELEQLAQEFASRSLAQQEDVLRELRTRTATLLAAASLTASFLGAAAIDRDGLSVWSVLALVSLGVTVLLTSTGLRR